MRVEETESRRRGFRRFLFSKGKDAFEVAEALSFLETEFLEWLNGAFVISPFGSIYQADYEDVDWYLRRCPGVFYNRRYVELYRDYLWMNRKLSER